MLQQAQQQQQLLQLVDLGIQASLHQLVVTGVLHADPHPGNLLLSGGKLVYLDFGLLVRVPPEASMVSSSTPGWAPEAAAPQHTTCMQHP